MPRRRRHGVVALLAVAGATAGCQSADLGSAGCQTMNQATLAGSLLTLLRDARLDAYDGTYVLMGFDGAAVRWATLGSDGTLAAEHAFGLPTLGVASQPFFAVAGSSATTPGDTVLVGWLGPDATGKKGDLSMIAVPADGSPPMGPASVIHEFPTGVPPDGSVVMVSSRKGTNAGLAWADPVSGQVQLAAVNAMGALVGAATPTAPVTAPYDCLSFQAGKDDLTLVYHATITAQNGGTGWIVVEANDTGSVDSYTTMGYSGPYTKCALITPTANGYGMVWQDSSGGQLGVSTAGAPVLPPAAPFAPSSGFGGVYLQPPIVGLASYQQDFGVLFQRAADAELWRIDQTGDRRSGALILPSAQGNLGTVATTLSTTKDGMLVQGGPLVVTYADYTGSVPGADGGTTMTGNRVFLNAICR